MKKSGKPLDFLSQAQSDKKTSAAVQAAIEKGAAVTAAEVLKIAKKAGFSAGVNGKAMTRASRRFAETGRTCNGGAPSRIRP